MTEHFYRELLEYLDPSEKKTLLEALIVARIRVNGFRSIKDVPIPLLATYLSRNETKILGVLNCSYTSTFTSIEEAIKVFSPKTAISCLIYFLQNDQKESFIISLIRKNQINSIKNEDNTIIEKEQKKSDEFRKKYLCTLKELKDLKELYSIVNNENLQLKNYLDEKNTLLNEANNSLTNLQTQYNSLNLQVTLSHEKHINQIQDLENRLDILTSQKEHDLLKTKGLSRSSIMVLVANQKQAETLQSLSSDIATLEYAKTKINEIDSSYKELLCVSNDVPFSIKRQITKNEELNGKLHTFATKGELVEYVKRRGLE